MSLFPAYSNNRAPDVTPDNNVTNVQGDSDASTWLTNSSFQTQISTTRLNVTESDSDETVDNIHTEEDVPCHNLSYAETKRIADRDRKSKHVKKLKKEKRKHVSDRKRRKGEYEKDVENVYFEDKFRDKRFHTVDTLCSKVRPLYNVDRRFWTFQNKKRPKKEIFQRYHIKNIDVVEKTHKKDNVIKRGTVKDTSTNDEDALPPWCANLEVKEKATTREYNEALTKDPNNIQIWINYIEFQDTLAKFQKQKLLMGDSHRSVVMKKLSIAEKGLEKNPDSIELLKLKLQFMGELLPGDTFSTEVQALVNKDNGNIVLWKTYIMITQGSLAMCTVPKVLDLYAKCFCILRQRSRTNSRVFDEILLDMLHRCLIFLRHTGLWEQMWETIRLNLSLNLSLNQNSLSLKASIDEKELIGMEEVILMSKLPLNQLWLRTESLRENCHWISVTRDKLELVGDSRRFILPEDVADFVHPIVTPDSSYKMAIYSLLALKVPLLPTRDCMLKDLGMDKFEWNIDSVEALLSFSYPSVGELAGHKARRDLLKGIIEGRLTSGPQYLLLHPAQEPFLEFLRKIFHTIADNLSAAQRTSIFVWWLRFERLLVSINKNDPSKPDRSKKLRITLKEFLKRDENRNNLYFYKEYALIEKEIGRFENCINILMTAIHSQGTSLVEISDQEEKAALFNLYRTVLETLLDTSTYKECHRERIISIIGQMVSGSDNCESSHAETYLQNCVETFLKESPSENAKNTLFLPNLNCDIVVCYVYYLYAKDCDIYKVVDIFRSCIEHSKENPYLQEMLYESEVSILQLHFEQKQELYNILRETLNDALNIYPSNTYMLSIFATIQSELPCWKLNSVDHKINLWKEIAKCLAYRRRINFLTRNGQLDIANTTINKLLSFHRTLAKLPETRCCPLLWRMYMLLLREHNLCTKKGEEVYHESVGNCPWVRSMFIDAAEVAPQLLTQIQDVIREKELRMHVTPEELDILRG